MKGDCVRVSTAQNIGTEERTIRLAGTDQAFVQRPADRSLLQAAIRAGIGFPYECCSGGCGSCRFKLVSGEVESLSPDAPGLSERDRRKGLMLGCQTRALTDVEIQVATRPECCPAIRPQCLKAELVSVEAMTRDMRLFTLRTAEPAAFLPGQYAVLEDGGGLRRCYSMSNLPNREGIWQFVIKRVPGGKFTAALFALEPGATLWMDAPYGLAHVRAGSPRDVLCVAGGSGLAPILSIARAVATDPAQSGKRIHIFYGGRTAQDICCESYLDDLPGWRERIHFHPVVSEPGDPLSRGWSGETGFVHDSVVRILGPEVRDFEIYFAGPPPMATALQTALMIDLKVPFDQIHFDRFF